jgi:hypothetical protein
MSHEVPPLYWFMFWVALSVGVLSFGFFMAIIIYRGNMRALDVLKTYAEKGAEPPSAVLEMLNKHLGESGADQPGRRMGTQAGNFTGMLAAACAGGGVAWWRVNAGGPQWVIYLFAASALFFAVRAFAYLFATLTKPAK